jgi:hypothetical protein
MPSPRKLIIYLACGIALFFAMAVLLKGRFVPVLAAIILLCVLIDGLLTGEIPFGQFNARRVYRRRESPVIYWSVMFFWALFVVVIAIVAFFGEGRSRTRLLFNWAMPVHSAELSIPERRAVLGTRREASIRRVRDNAPCLGGLSKLRPYDGRIRSEVLSWVWFGIAQRARSARSTSEISK